MSVFSIRPAVMEDLPAVIALLEVVDDLHREALPWLFRKVEDRSRTQFLEDYVSQPDRTMLVAMTSKNELAGVLYMLIRSASRAPIVLPALVAEIDSLVVDRSARRQGVGTRLVRAALQWARDQGAARTELGVYEFNDEARAFWESVGFQTLSRRMVARF